MWTYTPGAATDKDRVRLLATDTDRDNPIFEDEEIGLFLDLEGGDIRYAAADALDAIAGQQALLLKVVKQLDTQTDGAKLSAELRALAKTYREQADTQPGYEIAEQVYGPATALERIRKQRLRGLGVGV